MTQQDSREADPLLGLQELFCKDAQGAHKLKAALEEESNRCLQYKEEVSRLTALNTQLNTALATFQSNMQAEVGS